MTPGSAARFSLAVTVLPHGWIGTVDDWARGLGIAFAIVDLLLLFLCWRWTKRAEPSPASKQLLLVAGVMLPLAVIFFGYAYGLPASERVEACGSCHVMTPFVADLRNPASDTLAATHFKNRYIQQNHCYTCHTDYGMSGTIRGKWEGLGHVLRRTFHDYTLPIKIARPFSNLRCLACHGESQKFLNPKAHAPEDIKSMISGDTSCLDCHGPAHPKFDVAAFR